MEKHCTMVYFSLRESKQNKKGLSPIEVSITTNGKRIYFSTGKHVPVVAVVASAVAVEPVLQTAEELPHLY